MIWEMLGILILLFAFTVGLILTLDDIFKTWKKLHWTQKCYKIIISLGVAFACVRLIIMWCNL